MKQNCHFQRFVAQSIHAATPLSSYNINTTYQGFQKRYRTRAIINRGHYCKIHFLANRCGCYSREVTIQKKISDLSDRTFVFLSRALEEADEGLTSRTIKAFLCTFLNMNAACFWLFFAICVSLFYFQKLKFRLRKVSTQLFQQSVLANLHCNST